MELKIENVHNAQVRVKSEVGDYAVNALVMMDSEKQVETINDGYVMDGEDSIANFSSYRSTQMTINFTDMERMAEATTAAKDFCSYVRQHIAEMEVRY